MATTSLTNESPITPNAGDATCMAGKALAHSMTTARPARTPRFAFTLQGSRAPEQYTSE